jgi:hypothetical protein
VESKRIDFSRLTASYKLSDLLLVTLFLVVIFFAGFFFQQSACLYCLFSNILHRALDRPQSTS